MTDFETLEGTLAQVWQRLQRGVTDAEAPARTPAFATSGAAGPEARMVVLRAVDPEEGTVEIHTDARTAKVAALRLDPRAALLVWEPQDQFQIRLSLTCRLIQGDPNRWAKVPGASRYMYGATPTPGQPISAPQKHEGSDPDSHIAIIGKILHIDTVQLGHDLHRRALFEAPAFKGVWIGP